MRKVKGLMYPFEKAGNRTHIFRAWMHRERPPSGTDAGNAHRIDKFVIFCGSAAGSRFPISGA